jgi:hypothetical protein
VAAAPLLLLAVLVLELGEESLVLLVQLPRLAQLRWSSFSCMTLTIDLFSCCAGPIAHDGRGVRRAFTL